MRDEAEIGEMFVNAVFHIANKAHNWNLFPALFFSKTT